MSLEYGILATQEQKASVNGVVILMEHLFRKYAIMSPHILLSFINS